MSMSWSPYQLPLKIPGGKSIRSLHLLTLLSHFSLLGYYFWVILTYWNIKILLLIKFVFHLALGKEENKVCAHMKQLPE